MRKGNILRKMASTTGKKKLMHLIYMKRDEKNAEDRDSGKSTIIVHPQDENKKHANPKIEKQKSKKKSTSDAKGHASQRP